MPGFARHLNTPEVSDRDSLRDIFKDLLTYGNPLRFQVKAVITLPNEEDVLARTYHNLKRTELYPNDATLMMQPLMPFRSNYHKLKFLIN
jgi:hypothetical protein